MSKGSGPSFNTSGQSFGNMGFFQPQQSFNQGYGSYMDYGFQPSYNDFNYSGGYSPYQPQQYAQAAQASQPANNFFGSFPYQATDPSTIVGASAPVTEQSFFDNMPLATEQFYGSPTQIMQPYQDYYTNFPLPGYEEPFDEDANPGGPGMDPDPDPVFGIGGNPNLPMYDINDQNFLDTIGMTIADPDATSNELTQGFSDNDLLMMQQAGQALGFGGDPIDMSGYVTQDQFDNFNPNIDLTGYVTQEQLGNYNPYVDLSGYVSQEQFANYNPTFDTSGFITQDNISNYLPEAVDMSGYLTSENLSNYLPEYDMSGYLTADNLSDYLPEYEFDTSGFLTSDNLSDYLPEYEFDTSGFLTSENIGDYLPEYEFDTSGFLTSENIGDYLPEATDMSGYLTADNISDYLPANDFDTSGFLTQADLDAYTPSFDTSNFLTADNISDYMPAQDAFDPSDLLSKISALEEQLAALQGGGAATAVADANTPLDKDKDRQFSTVKGSG